MMHGTIMPMPKKGKYVDVTQKGPFIEITQHKSGPNPNGTIRLIPYQSNHGIAVEFYNTEKKMVFRTFASYDDFYRMGALMSELGEKTT